MQMEKRMLNTQEEWEIWKKEYSDCVGDTPELPRGFPCILCTHDWDQRGTHWNGGCYAYIYSDDFEWQAPIG